MSLHMLELDIASKLYYQVYDAVTSFGGGFLIFLHDVTSFLGFGKTFWLELMKI